MLCNRRETLQLPLPPTTKPSPALRSEAFLSFPQHLTENSHSTPTDNPPPHLKLQIIQIPPANSSGNSQSQEIIIDLDSLGIDSFCWYPLRSLPQPTTPMILATESTSEVKLEYLPMYDSLSAIQTPALYSPAPALAPPWCLFICRIGPNVRVFYGRARITWAEPPPHYLFREIVTPFKSLLVVRVMPNVKRKHYNIFNFGESILRHCVSISWTEKLPGNVSFRLHFSSQDRRILLLEMGSICSLSSFSICGDECLCLAALFVKCPSLVPCFCIRFGVNSVQKFSIDNCFLMEPYLDSINLLFYSIVWWCSGAMNVNLPSTCYCCDISNYISTAGLHQLYDDNNGLTIEHTHLMSVGWGSDASSDFNRAIVQCRDVVLWYKEEKTWIHFLYGDNSLNVLVTSVTLSSELPHTIFTLLLLSILYCLRCTDKFLNPMANLHHRIYLLLSMQLEPVLVLSCGMLEQQRLGIGESAYIFPEGLRATVMVKLGVLTLSLLTDLWFQHDARKNNTLQSANRLGLQAVWVREHCDVLLLFSNIAILDESSETLLNSFSPSSLLFFNALHEARSVTFILRTFVDDHGIYLGFRIRFSAHVEEKAKTKVLHPKHLGGMFFFFALGATGGVTSLLTSDKPIFEGPHAITGFIVLALLKIQRITSFLQVIRGNHHLEDKVVLKEWGNDTPNNPSDQTNPISRSNRPACTR